MVHRISLAVYIFLCIGLAHSLDEPSLSLLGFPDCIPTSTVSANDAVSFEEAVTNIRCQQQAVKSQSIKIACVGDSITAGGHASGVDATYPSQLQNMLDAQSPGAYEVTNLGAGGATLQRGGDSPYWQRPQFRALLQHKWDIVIIMLGTNDAKDTGDGGPPNWQHDCATAGSLVECVFSQEYKALIEVVRTVGPTPHMPPVIYTMIPPPLMQAGAIGANQTVINDVFPALVPLLTESLKSVRGPIDVFSALGGAPDWREKFPVDGCGPEAHWQPCELYCSDTEGLTGCDSCHPADSGYRRMAQAVFDFLEANGGLNDARGVDVGEAKGAAATSALSLGGDGRSRPNARAVV